MKKSVRKCMHVTLAKNKLCQKNDVPKMIKYGHIPQKIGTLESPPPPVNKVPQITSPKGF